MLALKLALGDGGKATNQQGALRDDRPPALRSCAAGRSWRSALAATRSWRFARAAIGHGRRGARQRLRPCRRAGQRHRATRILCVTAVKILGGSASSRSGNAAQGDRAASSAGRPARGSSAPPVRVSSASALYQGYKGITKKFLEDSKTEQMSPAAASASRRSALSATSRGWSCSRWSATVPDEGGASTTTRARRSGSTACCAGSRTTRTDPCCWGSSRPDWSRSPLYSLGRRPLPQDLNAVRWAGVGRRCRPRPRTDRPLRGRRTSRRSGCRPTPPARSRSSARASARGASTGCISRSSRSTGLTPGADHPYEVRLDGEPVWPEPDSRVPAEHDPPADRRRARCEIVFGSCRITLPHEPPYVLRAHEHPERAGHRRAARLRAARGARRRRRGVPGHAADARRPDLRRRAVARAAGGDRGARERPADAPEDELADFGEYALAYREAWSEPAIRWLLSTVPTTMVFDDHEIHAEWRISQGWMDEMNAEPWFDRHIRAGLMAYWVFQHLGNLAPARSRPRASCYDEVRGGRRRRRAAGGADGRREGRQIGHSRWSFARDIGDARLVVIDSRAGRERHARAARARAGRGVGVDRRAGARSRRATCCWPARCRSCSRPGLHYVEALGRGADRRRVGPARRRSRRAAAAACRDGPLGVVPAHDATDLRADRRHRPRARGRGARVDRAAVRRRAPLLPRAGRVPGRRRTAQRRVAGRLLGVSQGARAARAGDASSSGTRALAERLARRLARAAGVAAAAVRLAHRRPPRLRQPDRDADAWRPDAHTFASKRSSTETGSEPRLETAFERTLTG